MIDRRTLFARLLAAYPRFNTQHDVFTTDWADDAEGPRNHLLLADLARECSILLADNRRAEVREIFGVVEEWLLNGDKYVREAATVGFLAVIQNTNLHKGTEPDDFLPFCGPEALFWWKKVSRFWSHREAILDTRRMEQSERE